MQSFILCIFTLFIACNKEHSDGHIEKTPNAQVREKLSLYCEKSRAEFLARKWAVDECDALLFTSLRGIACGPDLPIEAYEDSVEPGKWYRDPKHSCYLASVEGEQGSDSSISKDMLIGLTAYALATKNVNILGRTIEYGKSRDWIVGEAKDNVTLLSKCFVTPSLQVLLRDAFDSLSSGLTDLSNSDYSVVIASGYQAHLEVLGILIRGKIDGKISSIQLAMLKEQAKRQPNNALFAAAKARYDDSDMSKAVDLLLSEKHWPNDHLPNNHQQHCSNYIYQRDEEDSGDWAPCPNEPFKEHDGTDFIFAAAVATGVF